MLSLGYLVLVASHFRVLLALLDHVVQGVEPVVEALARDGARRLDVVQVARAELVQSEVLLDLLGVPGAGQVLLVGQYQNGHLTVVRALGGAHELHFRLLHALHVHAVHDEHDRV